MKAREVAIWGNTRILVMIDGKRVTITAEELRANWESGGASSANPGGEPSEAASK